MPKVTMVKAPVQVTSQKSLEFSGKKAPLRCVGAEAAPSPCKVDVSVINLILQLHGNILHINHFVKQLSRGNPRGAIRPALARLPIHSTSSAASTTRFRPAGSFQDKPSSRINVVASDRPPSLYFCKRTPLPRPISGSSS